MDAVPRRDFVSFVVKNAREKNLLKKEREDCPTAYSFIFLMRCEKRLEPHEIA